MNDDINLMVNLTQKKKQQRAAKETEERKSRKKAWLIATLLAWGTLGVYSSYLYFTWVLSI